MKSLKLFLLVFVVISCAIMSSEAQEKTKKKGDVYFTPEEMPEYPGGVEALKTFIMKNVKYPEKSKKERVQGKVFVAFVVDKTGEVINAKVLRSVDPLLDKEAIRVINLMEKWQPGKEKGEPVKVQFTVPINFALS